MASDRQTGWKRGKAPTAVRQTGRGGMINGYFLHTPSHSLTFQSIIHSHYTDLYADNQCLSVMNTPLYQTPRLLLSQGQWHPYMVSYSLSTSWYLAMACSALMRRAVSVATPTCIHVDKCEQVSHTPMFHTRRVNTSPTMMSTEVPAKPLKAVRWVSDSTMEGAAESTPSVDQLWINVWMIKCGVAILTQEYRAKERHACESFSDILGSLFSGPNLRVVWDVCDINRD